MAKISRHHSSKNQKGINKMIFKTKPILKEYLWGGTKLSKAYNIKDQNIAEAWMLSTLEGNTCAIEGREESLKELFEKDKNIIKKGYKGDFPILVKLIDAQKDLSIQNHPQGKTESWHILECEKDSFLYYGLKKDVTKDELRKALNEGRVTEILNQVKVKPGDCFLIEAGTIHAIGSGIYLAEVQQNLNITYRLFDFNRVDKNGNKRELHIDQAVEVANLHKTDVSNIHNTNEGTLVKCKYFDSRRHRISSLETFYANDDSFNYLLVLDGEGELLSGKEIIPLKKNDSIFISASHGEYSIKGNLDIIFVTL